MNTNSTLEILALFTILALVGSTLTYIMILNAYSLEDEGPNNNITTYEDVNNVINEGLIECSNNLNNDACLGVMHTLNNICEVSYYPSCFGAKWSKFMMHLETLEDKEGHTS
jgi:hypothetical protein